MKSTPITPDTRERFQSALLEHYERLARDLPWRRDTDPYRVLVSEVMLQQTRVETVKGYYGRWIERFPTIDSLADAEEDEVLKAWEGLGYYRRARSLHRAARVVREDRGGVFPSRYDDLRDLPGVGEYTAGAVASIAFGEPVPAVDGNVRRVLARLFDLPDPKPAWLKATAGDLVDEDCPGDWNQAVMELGATVCTPRGPRCSGCPVVEWCAARSAGTELERPVVKARAGMWAFPEVESGELEGEEAAAVSAFTSGLGLEMVGNPRPLPPVRHRFTHLDMTYEPMALEVTGETTGGRGVGAGEVAGSGRDSEGSAVDSEGPCPGATGPCREADESRLVLRSGRRSWIDPEDTAAVALPVAQRKILESWLAQQTVGAT